MTYTFNEEGRTIEGSPNNVDRQDMRMVRNQFNRIFINEESLEEECGLNSVERDSNRSMINEDKERLGEQFSP